jgi:hypothetical protein
MFVLDSSEIELMIPSNDWFFRHLAAAAMSIDLAKSASGGDSFQRLIAKFSQIILILRVPEILFHWKANDPTSPNSSIPLTASPSCHGPLHLFETEDDTIRTNSTKLRRQIRTSPLSLSLT